jgi:hypothetical protein
MTHCKDERTNKTLTKAKIKRAKSADRDGSTTNELYCSLTVKCFEMPASF